MKRALLIIVHGSPDESANAPVHQVANTILSREVYPIVSVGFLECNKPAIPEAVKLCVLQGADRIDAVPYFLHTGKHVADDIPTHLEEARSLYPQVDFRLADFLGRSPRLAALLARRAAETRP